MTAAFAGFGAGLVIGILYFGALWMTVRRIPDSGSPALLVVASYAVRLALAGFGFYSVARLGGGIAILAALIGFLIVRSVMVRRFTPRGDEGAEGP